jgi:calcineurin-like phosphoesterase family protein
MDRFVIADPHFGHKNILEFASDHDDNVKLRPHWNTVDQMHDFFITTWNEAVRPQDKLYILGDVAMPRSGLKVLESIHCKKVLIRGNHDVFPMKDYATYFEDIRGAMVYKNCIMTHVPIHESCVDRFGLNIHGHLHDKVLRDAMGNVDTRYVCVSVEQVNYTPVAIESLL